MHIDLIITRDAAAITLIGSQYNLVAGTLARFARHRPDLQPLLKRVMDFDVSSVILTPPVLKNDLTAIYRTIFMLTELGHGLDARAIETTATLLPEGGFCLHTPTPSAAK